MKVKDTDMLLSDFAPLTTFNGGIEIVDDTGRSIFSVNLREDGSLEVRACGMIRRNGVVLSESISIAPRASNVVLVTRQPWQ